jgi:hypothetical protein
LLKMPFIVTQCSGKRAKVLKSRSDIDLSLSRNQRAQEIRSANEKWSASLQEQQCSFGLSPEPVDQASLEMHAALALVAEAVWFHSWHYSPSLEGVLRARVSQSAQAKAIKVPRSVSHNIPRRSTVVFGPYSRPVMVSGVFQHLLRQDVRAVHEKFGRKVMRESLCSLQLWDLGPGHE